ncbi:MAG TPA: hypothetical protein VK539_17065 [Myxococcaceae bacterium]|nr:hypothetical protein [Myxococcaceae bacterium]
MIPDFTSTGLLPPGVYETTWTELSARFGGSLRRKGILQGLRQAALALKRAGCRRLWIDGSFVTNERMPSDWDGCWDSIGVDPEQLDSVLKDLSPAGRRRMKTKYMTDLFPASIIEQRSGLLFVNYFQVDKATSEPKGILLLDLVVWTP